MNVSDTTLDRYEPISHGNRQVAYWLILVCVMIFAMVVLGGVTRLTSSGLSMTEWKPITGWLPPLTDGAWMAEFERYKQFPEYQKINLGMDLIGFKAIYWFEFSHRILGRSIGLVFLLPFLFFLWRKRIDGALTPKLWLMFALGGLQGGMGWWMVSSGLVERPDVSHYRLTAHLGLAVIIYGYGLWIALGLLVPISGYLSNRLQGLYRLAQGLIAAIFVVMLSGGLVAGLDAGFAYNTFPTMNGQWLPDGMGMMSPWYANIVENTITVQFNHRWLAMLTGAAICFFWFRALRSDVSDRVRLAVHVFLAALALQVTLGIVTLLLVIPVSVAAAHQAGALLLLTAALSAAHAIRSMGS
mgnify:CR=1 FL=1